MSSYWPTPQDYNEEIQNPHLCFSDPDLKNGSIQLNAIGLPRAMSGAFASVYKVTSNKRSWAVRCFLTNRLDQKERYKAISKFVLFDDLECTVDFHYLDDGIRVKGQWYPCLKMPWVEGETLDQFLAKHYKNTSAMKNLLEQFHKMVDELECAGVGHGDLQHGNIIVTTEGLRLVDYDALFVPALSGLKSLELGHPNYQHPDRSEHHYDPDVDNFSCWLIHASLLALAIDPDLYENFQGGDDCILFKRTDLANPEQSQLFQTLLNHTSPNIRESAQLLQRMLWAQPLSIPILDCPKEHLTLLPEIRGTQDNATDKDAAPAHESAITSAATNRYDFIDQDIAASAQARKLSRKDARRRKALDENRLKLLEKMHMFFSPHTWAQQHMSVALRHFDKGNYESALNTYLRIYKVMEKQASEKDEVFYSCLMGLGYCSVLSDKNALAGNYFLLAQKQAPSKLDKLRCALCLGLTRFIAQDPAGAIRLLKDNWTRELSLEKAVKLEIKNMFILTKDGFEMLMALSNHLRDTNDTNWIDALLASKLILDELIKTQSIRITEEISEYLLRLADHYLKNQNFKEALELYATIGKHATTSGSTQLALNCWLMTIAATGQQEIESGQSFELQMSELLSCHPEQLNDRIKSMAEFCKMRVSPRVIGASLVEITKKLIDNGFKKSALSVATLTMKNSTGSEMSENLESAFAQLSNFEDADLRECFSEVFLSDGKSDGKLNQNALTDLIIACGPFDRFVMLLTDLLASEEKMVALSTFFMQLLFDTPEQFEQVLINWEKPASAADTCLKALEEAAYCFAAELKTLFESSERNRARIIRFLNCLDLIRAHFSRHGLITEAEWVTSQIAQHDSQLLLAWMCTLETRRLPDFLKALPGSIDEEQTASLVSQMTGEENFKDFERCVVLMRTWENNSAIMQGLLLPATRKTVRTLIEQLQDIEASSYAGEKTKLFKETALNTAKKLNRLQVLARKAEIEGFFDRELLELYSLGKTKILVALLSNLQVIGETSLFDQVLKNMRGMQELIDAVFDTMRSTASTDVLIDTCQSAIKQGLTPHTVKVLLSTARSAPDQFKDLAMKLTKQLSDSDIENIHKQLFAERNEEAAEIFLNQVELYCTNDVLTKLLSRCGHKDASQKQTGRNNFEGGIASSKAADRICLAALEDEGRLAETLAKLDRDGYSEVEKKNLLLSVVESCQKSLLALSELEGGSMEAPTQKQMLAAQDLDAIWRLSNHLSKDPRDNRAVTLLHSERLSPQVLAWLIGMAEKNEHKTLLAYVKQCFKMKNTGFLARLFLELARANQTRAMVAIAKFLCDQESFSILNSLAMQLLESGFTDAFGGVALELVSSNKATQTEILQLLETIPASDREALKVTLRHISFYRGKQDLKSICETWKNEHMNPEEESLLLDQAKAMGLLP